jgi:hypothetical protein
MKKTIAALALYAFSVAHANVPNQGGNFYDGNRLFQLCTSSVASEQAVCLGYVIAVADTSRTRNCSPSTIKSGQLRDVVIQFLSSNPAHRHEDADTLVELAIHNAWPCQRQQNPARNSL